MASPLNIKQTTDSAVAILLALRPTALKLSYFYAGDKLIRREKVEERNMDSRAGTRHEQEAVLYRKESPRPRNGPAPKVYQRLCHGLILTRRVGYGAHRSPNFYRV